jgi:hypothetical protein
MGLGKQRAKLDGELFRRTEEQPEPTAPAQPVIQEAVSTAPAAKAKVEKERFSLYLEPTTAKRLRLYAVQNDIKNINGLVAALIEEFLKKEGA